MYSKWGVQTLTDLKIGDIVIFVIINIIIITSY